MHYFPNYNKESAGTQLSSLLRQNENLKGQLMELGFMPKKNLDSNPCQVELIVVFFGGSLFVLALGAVDKPLLVICRVFCVLNPNYFPPFFINY